MERKPGGMTCPQCGGRLATYALGGEEASVCEDCGYVGIAAEHRGDPRTVESWDDALRRFYRAHGSEGAPSVELRPPLSRPSSETGESWDDALRRFYARTGDEDGNDPRRDADASPSDGVDGERDAADGDADDADTQGDVARGMEAADVDDTDVEVDAETETETETEAEADASGR